jgi:hemoglobin
MAFSFYEQIGSEVGLKNLVRAFYQVMDTAPEVKKIRDMHPADLEISEEKLFMFLSGWMGGPSLYIERYGHPMLRRRHFPFSIGEEERDQWMFCMRRALESCKIPEQLQKQFIESFSSIADHMRNRPSDSHSFTE